MNSKGFRIALGFLLVIGTLFFLLKYSLYSDSIPTSPQVNSQTALDQQSFSVVPPSQDTLIKSHSPILGSFSAKVTIVEFLDPECEACSAMFPHTKAVLKEFGEKVRLVIRYMPFHPNSLLAANILEGARAQNKYWEAMALLFENQPEWAGHQAPRPDLIPEILKPLKLDMKKIMQEANDGRFTEQIKIDQADGKRAGVSRTPTFFINGQRLEQMGYEPLRDAVASQLESLENGSH